PSIRVGLDRLDSLMNLVGELMIAYSRLEQRLSQLDRVGGLLGSSRTRLGRAARSFEAKHHDPRVSTDHGGGDGGSEPPAGPRATMAELFAELEFDRYDDFSILSRGLGELSEDIGEAQAQYAALLRAIREDTAQIRRLMTALRNDVTQSRMVQIGRLYAR